MEQATKKANQQSVIFALIHGATYLPATWLLKHHVVEQPVTIALIIVSMVTFALYIVKLINAVSTMDEVKQRVQLEAVVIGFSLTVMLIMLIFLLDLCGISNPDWFSYGYLVCYCWLFYFIGWAISRRKYGL